MRRWTTRIGVLLMMTCFLGIVPAQAQQNLLVNAGFESDYSGRAGRGDFNFPSGWDGWWTDAPSTEAWMNVPPTGYPHSGPFRRSGANAQSIAKGGGSFTAAAIQIVDNIPAGAQLQGSVWVYIENGQGANAQVRIGIGSNVGNNVYGNITWSDWEKDLNSLQQISVTHTATGGSVSLFIYATQTWPNDPNAVYLDDAELVIVGQGQAPAPATGSPPQNNQTPQVVAQPTTAPRSDTANFVSPQTQGGSGGTKHTVRSGDTIAAISVAYGVSVDRILQLNNLQRGSFLQVGQELIIATPDPDQVETEEPTEDAPTVEVEVTEEPDSEEPTEAIVEETEEPTPAESPTPSMTPTKTPIPATSTPAPTAPVAEADAQTFNPTDIDTGLCVSMFDDDNQNGVIEPGLGEAYLADGVITLSASDGEEIEAYTTDGESEPYCYEELEAGRYTINATAPDGYGLTTAPIRRITLATGDVVTVQFGAKEGLTVLAIPTIDPSQPTEIPPTPVSVEQDEDDDASNDITDMSGLIVFGIAGIVLLGGLGASLILRRS